MAHNVEKITVQQTAGDISQGKPAETTVENKKIELFPMGAGFLYTKAPIEEQKAPALFGNTALSSSALKTSGNISTPLFGSKIINDNKAKKEVRAEAPETQKGFISTLSNYYKNIRYGITQLDAAADTNVKKALSYIPDRDSLYAAIDSNKRIAAILNEAGLLQP